MKAVLLTKLFVSVTLLAGSQARIVINNDAYITMSGGTAGTPIYVVVDNGASNAVSTAGTGGNWVSEGEYNKLRWNIGTNTGTYTVPFYSDYLAAGQKMPYSLQITGAGVGAGRVDFSTYESATDMNTPWASYVSHMYDAATATVDNSLNVVDRWWIIDANSYTTRPTVNMTIGYNNNAGELAGTNTLVEANLVAQRWNDPASAWEGNPGMTALYFGGGTLNTVARTLGPFAVAPADFHETWVLVDRTQLLPIELLSFTAECDNDNPKLLWSTASETNNDYFTILRSADGTYFITADNIQGTNTNSTQQYEYIDYMAPDGNLYYRLAQTDMDGSYTEFNTISIACSGTKPQFNAGYNAAGNELTVTFGLEEKGDFNLALYDDRGRLLWQDGVNAPKGASIWKLPVSNLSNGIYILTAKNESKSFTAKVSVSR